MHNEMKSIPFLSWLIFVWLLCICCLHTHFVSSHCHDDDMSLLLEFKNNITFTPDASNTLGDWNQSTNCCLWSGIQCDNSSTHVTYLHFSYLNITGFINNFSSLFRLPYLQFLDLSENNIHGNIPGSISSAKNLTQLDLSYNSLSGSIPTSIFAMPSLQWLNLKDNKFSGQINEFVAPSSNLQVVDFSNNNLEGLIPQSIFQWREVEKLYLSSNRFNGTLKLVAFLQSYKNLRDLDLSYNHLSVDTNGCGINSSFPQLVHLNLVSCNLHSIPEFLRNQTSITTLDLSMNQISGTLPWWILANTNNLNLSGNHLVEFEPIPALNISSVISEKEKNKIHHHHHFPIITAFGMSVTRKLSIYSNYLDFSNNHFTNYIDTNIDIYLTNAYYLSFSNNNLHGNIPLTLCNATGLSLLNLEFNHLNGMIPDCLTSMKSLNVLNLRGNNLHGKIPAKLVNQDCQLETLDLNRNFLQGRVPQSLANCNALKVLDLGNNELNDTFPCHLKSLPNLQVLILRSNKFHGTLVCPQSHSIWPMLQIVDLASNHFYGELRAQYLFNWTSMMEGTSKAESKLLSDSGGGYYQNSVAVTFKGNTYELQYILSIFSSIDFSNNLFHGELPKVLGNLNGLIVLNVSHNSFSGKIPPSIGNLTQIQSLDLSCNAFSGRIPPQLANLNFLEYLNLSYNKLSGRIPTSTQLQSFNASSYAGNQGLYGPPLTPFNRHEVDTRTNSSSQGSDWCSKSAFEWMLMGAEVGFPVGITVILGPLLYIKRYREWYCIYLHILVMKILRKESHARGRRRRVRQHNRQQRHRL